MNNLVIDSGNTLVKYALFEGNRLVELIKIKQSEPLKNPFDGNKNIKQIIFSSVNHHEQDFFDAFKTLRCPIVNVKNCPMPTASHYNLSTFGSDRKCAINGVLSFLGNDKSAFVVVNCGSCITYDFVGFDGRNHQHQGGNITLGLQMRFEAIHQLTKRLPLVEPKLEFQKTIGTNTSEAIQIGIQKGIVYEIEGFVKPFLIENEGAIVFLTGGNAFFFENQLNFKIFARQNLVLEGLNAFLKH